MTKYLSKLYSFSFPQRMHVDAGRYKNRVIRQLHLTRSGVDFFFLTADWTFFAPGKATLTVFASFLESPSWCFPWPLFECEADVVDGLVAPSSRMLVVSDASVWLMFARSGESESALVFVPRRIASKDILPNLFQFISFYPRTAAVYSYNPFMKISLTENQTSLGGHTKKTLHEYYIFQSKLFKGTVNKIVIVSAGKKATLYPLRS